METTGTFCHAGYRRGNAGLERPIELSREAGDVLTTTLLPEVQLPLDVIFKD